MKLRGTFGWSCPQGPVPQTSRSPWRSYQGATQSLDPGSMVWSLLHVASIGIGRFEPAGRWFAPVIWLRRYRIPMFSEAVIAEAARRLSVAAPGAKVILFGSHARGDAGRGSDLDFLVVEPEVEDAVAESVRLRRTLRGLGVFADVVVISDQDAEEWRGVRGSLIHAALADGRAIAA